MLRSIVSIVVGFIVWYASVVILWILFGYNAGNMPSSDFLMFSVVVEALFAVGVGYLTALIAKKKEHIHGIILGIVFAVYGIVDLIIYFLKDFEMPFWVPVTTIVIIAPCAVLGGWLRSRRVDRIWDRPRKKGGR